MPETSSSQRILITGGCGFIGSNLVRMAIGRGHQVCNVDALTYAGNLANLETLKEHPRMHFVRGDIRDSKLVGEILRNSRPLPEVPVLVAAGETIVARSLSGEFGEFQAENLPRDSLSLSLLVGHDERIDLPLELR